MGRTINTADLHNVVLQRRKEYGKFADVIEGAIEEMVAATPTTDRTNQDFIDRCRECGKTAITRAENDEILNEAWHLLQNVTEEDGVTTEEANGMIKLLALFLHKYHNQKKPEWAENVEARLEREKVDRTIRTIGELLPRDKEEDQEHESEEEENK
jgi:hypothetical protein